MAEDFIDCLLHVLSKNIQCGGPGTMLCAYDFTLVHFLGMNAMQIKDMASKFSGASKQSKPPSGSSSSNLRRELRKYPDFDAASDSVPYPYMGGGSTSSTPAWDFTSSSHHQGGRADSKFTSMYGGERESISAQSCDVVLEDDEPKEWMAQVEPGVHITFVSLPSGGNDLKRIRFRYVKAILFTQNVYCISKCRTCE